MNIARLKKIDYFAGHFLIAVIRPFILFANQFIRRDHLLVVHRQLVIIKIFGGGSLLIALPALRALRKRYPNQCFTLVSTPAVKAFAELMGIFDRYCIIDTSGTTGFLRSCLRTLATIWRADAILNLEIHSKLTTVFAFCSAARNRIGFYMAANNWQRGITTHLFYYNFTSPIYHCYSHIAEAFGADPEAVEQTRSHFFEHNGLVFPVRNKGTSQLAKIGIAPFCSELGREREFSAEEWISVLNPYLQESAKKTSIAIFGGPSDRERAQMLMQVFQQQFVDFCIINLAGKLSLLDSTKVLCELEVLFTIDSGLNHLARLIGVNRLVSFWGPTDPTTRLIPIDSLDERVVYRKLFCSPCIHIIEPPPCRGNNLCMKQHCSRKENDLTTKGWIVTANE